MIAKPKILIAGLLCLALVVMGCAGGKLAAREKGLGTGAVGGESALRVTIATGDPEGTYYQIGQDIKELAEKEGIRMEIIQTNGSFENINLLGAAKSTSPFCSWMC
jgi:TRAP-type uncharacterized transport system substrate-binding protein